MTKEQYLKIGRSHHLIPPLLFGPWAVVMTTLAFMRGHVPAGRATLFLILGLLSWTLLEYVLHRFSFHHVTENETVKLLTSGLHLLHHEKPNLPDYVIAPLVMSIPTYLAVLGVFWLITMNFADAELLGSGLALGYLAYEWVHYAAHHHTARTPLGKFLKRYHLIHHFKNSDNYFGVTSPLWDFLFGTKPAYDPKAERHTLPIVSRSKEREPELLLNLSR